MFLLILLLIFFSTSKPILANDRNIFGLHLTQTSDILKVKNIVNSKGGDWGWVTIVIRLDQLNRQTWQEFFDNCRRYHLIPILRLATIMDNNRWKIPQNSDIDNLASFLNSLNWPSEKQHLILFNEINHASEWGGGVNISQYTDIAIYASRKFKSLNPNFFLLPAAIDLAAPSKTPEFESAANTYRQILEYRPDFFDYFDALASHSYPNHGFVGTPNGIGQHSIRGYQWELNQIKKQLPIFITETGWPHREGKPKDNRYYSLNTVTDFLKTALNIWQKDSQVIAVTPFIYNYPNPPFDHFSWLDSQEKLYPEYQKIVDFPKSKNNPPQITSFKATKIHLPLLIFTDTDYTGNITLKNTGQSIWGESQFCLPPKSSPNISLEMICTDENYVYPDQSHTLIFKFRVSVPKNKNDRSFLGWQDLPQYQISPINSSGTIYHPKLKLIDQIKNLLTNILLVI